MADLLSEFLVKEPPKVAHIIGRGILPVRGKLVLGGKPKAGKSYLILNLALDLAMGRDLFGAYYSKAKPVFPVREAHRVLYIENEVGEHGLQERLLGITKGDIMEGVPLFIKSRDTRLRMDTQEGSDAIAAEIKSCRPAVVIIDPLAKFHLSDENSAQMMGAIMRTGDHWIEDFGVAIIYIHHTGHSNPQFPRRGGERLRGSTAIFADADTIVLVESQSAASCKEPVLKLDFEMRRGEPLEPIFVKRRSDGTIQYQGENLINAPETEFLGPKAFRNL